jgi:hypothetical protein
MELKALLVCLFDHPRPLRRGCVLGRFSRCCARSRMFGIFTSAFPVHDHPGLPDVEVGFHPDGALQLVPGHVAAGEQSRQALVQAPDRRPSSGMARSGHGLEDLDCRWY